MSEANSVVAMLLAGGEGKRLKILSYERAKPAVPFGGIYRIIDFTLSNAMHSGIQRVAVLTQYLPSSLMDHLANGESWDLVGRTRELKVLPPGFGSLGSDWYLGTADAVYQNHHYLRRHAPDLVLILSGDHIYKMDYRELIRYHREKGAAVTLATMRVPLEECSRFGVMATDSDGRITEFQEKPEHPKYNLASLGIYCFDYKVLQEYLIKDAKLQTSSHDFGKDIMPTLVEEQAFYAYEFSGYWRDVGTVESYWDANMDVLRPESGLNLNEWKVRTNLRYRWVEELFPSRVSSYGMALNSLVSKGCLIEGEVRNSILGPGVVVQRNSLVEDAIIMHDVTIGQRSRIHYSIIDKDVVIGNGVTIGNPKKDVQTTLPFSGISLIGKRVKIPSGYRIGSGCMISPKLPVRNLPPSRLDDGKFCLI